MRRLVYTSVSTRGSAEADAQAILTVARALNGADGITGLLCARGERYLQVIEGPHDSVANLWARICRDPRHGAIEVLDDRAIDSSHEREFGDWAMAFRADPHAPAFIDERLDVLLAGVSPAVAKEVRRFVAEG